MMAKTLQGSLITLKQDLYNAFYEAYMTQYTSDPTLGSMNTRIEDTIKDTADKFASSLKDSLGDAIYNFVKEIGITITVNGTIISPSGPCTGVINMTDVTII